MLAQTVQEYADELQSISSMLGDIPEKIMAQKLWYGLVGPSLEQAHTRGLKFRQDLRNAENRRTSKVKR